MMHRGALIRTARELNAGEQRSLFTNFDGHYPLPATGEQFNIFGDISVSVHCLGLIHRMRSRRFLRQAAEAGSPTTLLPAGSKKGALRATEQLPLLAGCRASAVFETFQTPGCAWIGTDFVLPGVMLLGTTIGGLSLLV